MKSVKEEKNKEVNLEDVRMEIDRIDREILSLFEKRMDCAKQVAEVKKRAGLPVLNPKREEEILARVEEKAGKLGGYAKVLFSTLMQVSRSFQHDLLGTGKALREEIEEAEHRKVQPESGNWRIGCQGVKGAYSHEAARAFFPLGQVSFYPAWEDVFQAVERGEIDYGVLPVENSSAGSVSEVYDLLIQYHFSIVGAVDLPVSHCLAGAGERIESVRKVYSHPQALAQCSEFIEKYQLEAEAYSNTAAAAEFVARQGDEGIGAICSPEACERTGLHMLKKDIQNDRENSTRFVIVSKRMVIDGGADKISLCFTLPHKTGSLYMVLSQFASHGLNLTKIESRPMTMTGKKFEYIFYLDFAGSVREPKTCSLLCSLSEELPSFRFLGNYPEITAGR